MNNPAGTLIPNVIIVSNDFTFVFGFYTVTHTVIQSPLVTHHYSNAVTSTLIL